MVNLCWGSAHKLAVKLAGTVPSPAGTLLVTLAGNVSSTLSLTPAVTLRVTLQLILAGTILAIPWLTIAETLPGTRESTPPSLHYHCTSPIGQCALNSTNLN